MGKHDCRMQRGEEAIKAERALLAGCKLGSNYQRELIIKHPNRKHTL